MTLCGWKIFSKSKRGKNNAASKVDTSASSDSGSSQNNKKNQNLNTKAFPSFDFVVCRDDRQHSPAKNIANIAGGGGKDDGDDDGLIGDEGSIIEIPVQTEIDNEEELDEDGNPRNKCALKPGHSLMDWIRYGSTGIDLAGNKGIISPVSNAELAKHCKQNDAWLAIRGKVFNVTHYMEYHPGGPDELIKGAGKDATKLFEDVHAWVNYEQLLSKCYVGPLQNTVLVDLDPFKSTRASSKPTSPNGGLFKTPYLPFLTSHSARTSPVKTNNNTMEDSGPITKDKPEIIPRFDWIQKTSDITLIFYTKSFCNPGLVIEYKNSDSEIDIRILIERTTHFCNLKLSHQVNWPCSIKVSYETGKIELIFGKTKPELWTSFGIIDRRKYTEYEEYQFEYEVSGKSPITYDSFGVILKPKGKTHFYYPVGYHISVTANINGCDITRSYTPVPVTYVPIECPNSCVPLLIKSYSSGILAKHITSLPSNISTNLLKLSQPKGNLILEKMVQHSRIGLLAAGSGITPILAVLDHLLLRISNKVENIHLMLFNKSEEDIWCRQKLETMALKDSRLNIRHILSEPQHTWTGEIGRVSEDIILELNNPKSTNYVTFCCVCGPTPFNDLSQKYFKESGYSLSDLHFFQG